jgi:uncharacterized protein YbaP (TraB family)
MACFFSRSILLLASLSAASLLQAEGRYDPATGVVEFSCVNIVEDPSRIRGYTLTLQWEADDSFSVVSSQEVFRATGCDSSYSVVTEILSSEVRVVDAIYDVQLKLDSATSRYRLHAASFNRLSETSLWEVSNGVNTIYVGGTIHILQDQDYPLPPQFEEAYRNSELVVFEVDPAIPVTNENLEGFNLPPGETVLPLLSASVQTILDDFFKGFDRTLEDYQRRRPEFFNSVLYFFGARSYGFGPGVDDFFEELAKSEGKPTAGLELFDEQIGAIVDAYRDVNINWNLTYLLRLAYIQSGQIEEDLRNLIGQWREGRIDELAASNAAFKRSNPQQYESILANRNRNWIPVIESLLETPEVEMVLAGVAHFAGPDNVLALLEEAGYTVERYVAKESPFGTLKFNEPIVISLY